MWEGSGTGMPPKPIPGHRGTEPHPILTPPASYPDNAYRLCGVTRISLGEGRMASWVLETLLIKSHTLKATSSSALI